MEPYFDNWREGAEMTEAETILKMIETVQPDDTAKLDEIDARVWCLLKSKQFAGMAICNLNYSLRAHREGLPVYSYLENGKHCPTGPDNKAYTRSRDALKAIRPEGWICQGFFYNPATNVCGYTFSPPSRCFAVTGENGQGSEELAELHAIIQAIQHERGVE